jgi:hypothetical protein
MLGISSLPPLAPVSFLAELDRSAAGVDLATVAESESPWPLA